MRSVVRLAIAGLVALALWSLAWETLLAPLRPGGSWLALKALPLAALLLFGWRSTRRLLQWASLVVPFYLAEGVVRGVSEGGRHSIVAWIAAAIAVITFSAAIVWFRVQRSAGRRSD
ncbi:MAG TPA: DUF2069 domain-containing protein [Casimicrobiaceae bacterium]|nr:DUF2069 domain-containing protein [Casimicrobiaceae bacterium]